MNATTTPPLVEVRDLSVKFAGRDATVSAVNGVSFSLKPAEVLCLIGESGSGKSVTMRALMGLLPKRRAQVDGYIRVAEHDILALDEHRLATLRGSAMAMIFQEPMTALDPVYTIGKQIAEAVQRHAHATRQAATARALELLQLVKVPSPGAAAQSLSARAVGRHAPARDDRDRARLSAGAAPCRRADHGARCDGAGSGADPLAQAAAGIRHGADVRDA